MSIWAIADLHLSFGTPGKEMDIFGDHWKGWTDKIAAHWRGLVKPDDLVLIAGDISWAMRLADAKADLDWIGELPGTKVMIRGNHDYWWNSLKQIEAILPPSCHLIQNNSFRWKDIIIGGTRLWDVPGLEFSSLPMREEPTKREGKTVDAEPTSSKEESEKIYLRELARLETSLKTMDKTASLRIAMTHYPPIGPHLEETAVSRLFEKYGIDIVVFGHLHNIKPGSAPFGKLNGVTYHLTACDYLDDFLPLQILP